MERKLATIRTISELRVIEGADNIPEATTPGAFLNFGGTNIYKASQLIKIAEMFCNGKIKSGDKFLYTDAWNQPYTGTNNEGYWDSYANTQIKDFADVIISDVINNPNRRTNYANEAYVDIIKTS